MSPEATPQTEQLRQHDSTLVVLLPGVLSPSFPMRGMQHYLQKQGFQNTALVGLRGSIGKFENIVKYAVTGIKKQVDVFRETHQGNNPQNLVIVGFSFGGVVGAATIEAIKNEKFSVTNPRLITVASPARKGDKQQSIPLRTVFSLAHSYRHKPDVTFPSKGWMSIYSPKDEIVDPQRTAVDEKGNKPEEHIAVAGLSHFQIIDPRKTGPLLVDVLNRIEANS